MSDAPTNQCTARSKRTEKRCGQPAIPGGSVCHYHGGGAPQVRAAAALRLAALVDPAIGVLAAALKQKKDYRLAVNAAQDVLDRNNLSGKQVIEVRELSVADILRRRFERRTQTTEEQA